MNSPVQSWLNSEDNLFKASRGTIALTDAATLELKSLNLTVGSIARFTMEANREIIDTATKVVERSIRSHENDSVESSRQTRKRRRASCGLADVPADAMNVLLSYLTFEDYVSLSNMKSERIYSAVSQATHLYMNDSALSATSTCTPVMPLNKSSPPLISRSVPIQQQWDEASLTAMLDRFDNLTVLHLTGLTAVGDSLFRILNQCPAASSITSLSLSGVSLSYWCHETLQLPHLKHLQLVGGSIRASLTSLFGGRAHAAASTSQSPRSQAATLGGVRQLPQLESLTISQCSSLRDDQVRDLVCAFAPTLKRLSVLQCLRLKRPVFNNLPVLEHACFMGCFALEELPGLYCPRLKSLDLSFCFRISSSKVHQLLYRQSCNTQLSTLPSFTNICEASSLPVDHSQNCLLPALENLKLIKCTHLQSLHLADMPALANVNVSFSNSLQSLQISNCPSVQQVDTISCTALESCIVEDSSALQKLNLSFLTRLVRLELINLPELKHLNLAGCKRLDRCVIHCPALDQVDVHGGCRVVALRFCKQVRDVLLKHLASTELDSSS